MPSCIFVVLSILTFTYFSAFTFLCVFSNKLYETCRANIRLFSPSAALHYTPPFMKQDLRTKIKSKQGMKKVGRDGWIIDQTEASMETNFSRVWKQWQGSLRITARQGKKWFSGSEIIFVSPLMFFVRIKKYWSLAVDAQPCKKKESESLALPATNVSGPLLCVNEKDRWRRKQKDCLQDAPNDVELQ